MTIRGDRRYPTVYFLYGEEMLRLGLASVVDGVGPRDRGLRRLDERLRIRALAARRARPHAGRSPRPPRRLEVSDAARGSALGQSSESTRAATPRSISPFAIPGTFGRVAAQSVLAIGQGGEELLARYRRFRTAPALDLPRLGSASITATIRPRPISRVTVERAPGTARIEGIRSRRA